ncbi:MAG: HDOD domain-containing protein [Planctomycetota bacterium]
MPRLKIDLEEQARALAEKQASGGIAARLLDLTSTRDYAVRQVADCLAGDPVLASRLLRAVNVSHYGLRHRVGSVERAVAILGQRSLRLLAVSFAVVGKQQARIPGAWRRSLTVATAAGRLADRDRLTRGQPVDTGEAYIAGLLADIGTFVFATLRPEVYPDVIESCVHGEELVAAEREMFGLGHPELGARFLSRWRLPEVIGDAVARHHADSEESADPPAAFTRVIQAADVIGRGIDSADPARVAAAKTLWARIDPDEDATAFVRAVAEEVDAAAALFDEEPADPAHRDRVLEAWSGGDGADETDPARGPTSTRPDALAKVSV